MDNKTSDNSAKSRLIHVQLCPNCDVRLSLVAKLADPPSTKDDKKNDRAWMILEGSDGHGAQKNAKVPLTRPDEFILGKQYYDGCLRLPTPNQLKQLELEKITELDEYKTRLIQLDTRPLERELSRVENELSNRFDEERKIIAARKIARTKLREQLEGMQHDGSELKALDDQSHDDSRKIRQMKLATRMETEPLRERIREQLKQQSKLKKERAEIARCLQQTLREGYLWETILGRGFEETLDPYREFTLVRALAARARYSLQKVEYTIVANTVEELERAVVTVQDETNRMCELSREACSPLCTLANQEGTVKSLPPLNVVYEDEWFVIVGKPSGLLSVPGRRWAEQDSVITRVALHFPEASGPLSVHRIDQATSGLQIVALNAKAHRELSMLFQSKRVEKTYVADVEGQVEVESGVITLPLRPHYMDRIRQMVDEEKGKKAITKFRVIHRGDNLTRLSLEPVTGRTHQLRVHCADPKGLGCPIFSDKIYGVTHENENMRLHAGRLKFVHPFTGRDVDVSCAPPF